MNLAQLSDQELQSFILNVFQKYDGNNNGTLEAPEIASFFTDLYHSLGYNVSITLPVAQQVIKEISQTGRNSLNPVELYTAFKIMSSNTTAYFQQFAPISPLDYIPKQQGQGMDVENCKEWDWNYPNPK